MHVSLDFTTANSHLVSNCSVLSNSYVHQSATD